MPVYREGFIDLLYAIILAQFVMIAVLLGGYSNQYFADDYFRAWINANYPLLGTLLHGQVDALLVGMALGATILIIQHIRREEELGFFIRPLSSEEEISTSAKDQSSHASSTASFGKPKEEQPADILAELEKSD